MRTYRKADEAIKSILTAFKEGRIPEAMSYQFVDFKSPAPCRRWSANNQLIIALSGHRDARGYKQWKKVGRQVKKGEKATHILIPLTYKKEEEDPDTGETKETFCLTGFSSAAVFGKEQTEGKPIPGDVESEQFIAGLPLIEVAEKWGIDVELYNGKGARMAGSFGGFGKNIALGVQNLSTWAHEMVHAAEDRLHGLKPGQQADQEIVAELGGATLLEVIGHKAESDRGGAYRYIKRYAKGDPVIAALNLVNRISEAVTHIIEEAEMMQKSNFRISEIKAPEYEIYACAG